VLLHDASERELIGGLQSGMLELAVMPEARDFQVAGIEFEPLLKYPFCVVLPPAHPLARLKSIPLEKVAAEPLVILRRKDYPEYHRLLNRVFGPLGVKPRVALECDSTNSTITAVEAGRGITFSATAFKPATGKRLVYRPLTGTNEVLSVGIARARSGDVTPAGEKFCEILRKISKEAITTNLPKRNGRSSVANAR
jgi:DNA-binding transcriptional LysR family regulator